MADVEKNHKMCDARLDGARREGVLGESPLIAEAEGVNGQLAGIMVSSDAISVSSSTKTKSAQLSGNGYSEEMEKIYRHETTFQVGINQHADLGIEKNLSESSHVPHESDLSAPPGFGIGEVLAPPGFEGTNSPEVSPVRKVKGTKRLSGQSAKRVTRSQAKQSKKHETMSQSTLVRNASGKQCVEGSPLGSDSAKTSESITKIVREALEVGKLLGVKVIANEAEALKRITGTLKSNTSSRPARSTQKSKLIC